MINIKKYSNEIVFLETIIGVKQSEIIKLLGFPFKKIKDKVNVNWYYEKDNNEIIVKIRAGHVIDIKYKIKYSSQSMQQVNFSILKNYLILGKYKLISLAKKGLEYSLKNLRVLLNLEHNKNEFCIKINLYTTKV